MEAFRTACRRMSKEQAVRLKMLIWRRLQWPPQALRLLRLSIAEAQTEVTYHQVRLSGRMTVRLSLTLRGGKRALTGTSSHWRTPPSAETARLYDG